MLKTFIESIFRISYYEFKSKFSWIPWLILLLSIYFGFQSFEIKSNHLEVQKLETLRQQNHSHSASTLKENPNN